MTKDEAISLAADWWVQQIEAGNWDNGDAKSELMHGWASHARPLERSVLPAIREIIIELLNRDFQEPKYGTRCAKLYCDYGNGWIDDAAKARGLNFSSLIHAPCKSGTNIEKNENGGYCVMAKAGYGGAWEIVEKLP